MEPPAVKQDPIAARLGTCAFYRHHQTTIWIPACANIGYGGRAWSYPGYVIDRTPYGVLQHELGHAADLAKGIGRSGYYSNFSVNMRKAAQEDRITGYCPNDAEWFAEMFRLFVTNSDLLKKLRPRTYAALKEHFKPVIDKPWRKVLKDAPERTIAQAAKKIEAVK
jgi:hypothetical protein